MHVLHALLKYILQCTRVIYMYAYLQCHKVDNVNVKCKQQSSRLSQVTSVILHILQLLHTYIYVCAFEYAKALKVCA